MSYYCHSCGTVIEEDEDTLCGKCKRTAKGQTFYVIKRDEEPRYIGFDSDEDGENVPYFSAFYKADLYIDKDVAEDDLKAAKEDGWNGLNTARIVKVRVEEVNDE
jgi:hypothetical protein